MCINWRYSQRDLNTLRLAGLRRGLASHYFYLLFRSSLFYFLNAMKRWIIGCFVLVASFAQAKTKLLVEDPNNVVAGRYSLTSEQQTHAKQTAEIL